MYNKTNKANNKKECVYMDNEVKEILMQLVDTTNKLAEGQKQMSADIAEIKDDIAEIKEEAIITRTALNRQGDMLDQLVDFVNDFLPAEFKYDPNK